MPQIAADLGYTPPSFNAFDRVTDVDTPLRSYQDLGGTSLNVDWKVGPGRLTSTTAWRYWNWNPSNDRDFIGLPITPISAAPSKQQQWTQEVRYAGDLSPTRQRRRRRLRLPPGRSIPTRRSSRNRARRPRASCSRRARHAATPGLLDGYGYDQFVDFGNASAAVFGQLEWSVTDRLRLLPGLRFNYDQKDVDFDQQVYGGLQTTDPALIALQRSVLAPQAYDGGRGRHQPLGSDDGRLQGVDARQRVCDLRHELQVGRPQPERRADRRAGPAGALGRDGQARRRAPRRVRREDGAAPRRHRERHASTTPRSRTSRRRS